jgi:hypothetical protein
MMPGSRTARFLMSLLVLVIVAGLIMSTCSLPMAA